MTRHRIYFFFSFFKREIRLNNKHIVWLYLKYMHLGEIFFLHIYIYKQEMESFIATRHRDFVLGLSEPFIFLFPNEKLN